MTATKQIRSTQGDNRKVHILTDCELDAVAGGAQVVTACQTTNRWESWMVTYFNVCPGTTWYPGSH